MDLNILHQIDEDLESSEVSSLKFLCLDHIPKKKQQTIKDAKDLFLRLKDKGLMDSDDSFIIAELLYLIKRFKLLALLGKSKQEVEETLRTPGKSRICSYRKMLFELSEDVTDADLKDIKFFLIQKLPRCKLEDSATFLDVLIEMEKQDILGEDNLEVLEEICQKISKDLEENIEEFKRSKEEYITKLTGMPGAPLPLPGEAQLCSVACLRSECLNISGKTESQCSPGSVCKKEMYDMSHKPRGYCIIINNKHFKLARQREPPRILKDREGTDIDAEMYDMSHKPRGYCIIINNKHFKLARQREPPRILKDREGTDIDAESLQKVFKELHFEVIQHDDLNSSQLYEVMGVYQKKDHSNRDAFICCILSHGVKGAVEAVDGCPVPIRDLTSFFTSRKCPSLIGKPKIFFIQACQGSLMQKGAEIQADGENQYTQQYETDAEIMQPNTIPDDSDFLLGMATVEDYLSFRSVYQGSFYIQALCRNLGQGCRSLSSRNKDILTILTAVNREVSQGNYANAKQMPEPRYTLTKRLVFPIS
ncbi:CASP8 protein, partial [Amia calva]|nr:CASP8 protein [Amia calva]